MWPWHHTDILRSWFMLVVILLVTFFLASMSYTSLLTKVRVREVRAFSRSVDRPQKPPSPSLGFGTPQPKIISNLSIDQLLRQNKYQKLKDSYSSKEKGSRVFDDHVSFPCDFTVKIIGENDETGELVRDMVSRVAKIVDTSSHNIRHSVRDSMSKSSEGGRGKYISLTIVTRFQNSNQLYAVYDLISDPRVKYVI